MSKKPFAFWNDQAICDWFDGLSEDYIRSLIDLHDDHDITPRKAFHYVFCDLNSQLCTCQACELSLRPAPVQTPPSGSVAAPIEAAQGQDTITQQSTTLESFQRWLEDQAHAARFAIEDGCDFFDRTVVHEPTIAACQLATAMVMRFKLEQGV